MDPHSPKHIELYEHVDWHDTSPPSLWSAVSATWQGLGAVLSPTLSMASALLLMILY